MWTYSLMLLATLGGLLAGLVLDRSSRTSDAPSPAAYAVAVFVILLLAIFMIGIRAENLRIYFFALACGWFQLGVILCAFAAPCGRRIWNAL